MQTGRRYLGRICWLAVVILATPGCAGAQSVRTVPIPPMATTTRYSPAPASQRFGINGQILFYSMPQQTRWAPLVAEMHNDGIQIVRADAPWENAQPRAWQAARGVYYWGQFDRIAYELADHGLRWLPIIDYSAPWAASAKLSDGSPDIFSPPASAALFANYAATVVRRYGPRGAFWRTHPKLRPRPVRAVEIWNEENTSFFWNPGPEPARYLELYEQARAAIHRIAPGVEVIVGGLSNPAADFLQGMYAAGRAHRHLFDAVAVHPYATDPDLVLSNVAAARRTLDAHGDIDTPLDVTEVGWPSLVRKGIGSLLPPPRSSGSLPYVSDAVRARDLAGVTQTLATADCGVERILPHTWVTSQQDESNTEDWFGIVGPDGTPTQTATAYSRTILALEQGASQVGAANTLCGRSFRLRVSPVNIKRRTHSHGRWIAVHQACVQVDTTSHGIPVDRASVRLTAIAPKGQPVRRVATRLTNSAGTALGCVTAARGTEVRFQIIASRSDFSSMPLERLLVRVP